MANKTPFISTPKEAIRIVFVALLAILSLLACQKEKIEKDATPPAAKCEGVFYAIKAESGNELAFTFHEFAKPLPEPFASTSKAGPFNVPAMSFFDIRSNFSAYDSTENRYVYQHYYYNTGAQFFSYDLVTGLPTLTQNLPPYDVSPEFQGAPSRRLYSIYAENLHLNEWQYSINTINSVTGQQSEKLIGGSRPINSPMTAEDMSAVSVEGDLIYFLSGTNLLKFNAQDIASYYINIDPSYHPIINNVQYFGLEYKRDEGLLLAMKNHVNESGAVQTTLVSINVPNRVATVTALFDISAQLTSGQDRFINPEVYSTAFDPCDNTYYITSLENDTSLSTNFIEINLPKNEMKVEVLDGYWYGLEYAPNK